MSPRNPCKRYYFEEDNQPLRHLSSELGARDVVGWLLPSQGSDLGRVINNRAMGRGCRYRPALSISHTVATENTVRGHNLILPTRWTHLEPYRDGRLEAVEDLFVSSVEICVRLLKCARERVTAFPPHAEQYHLFQFIPVKRVCPLSVVYALRNAGTLTTATGTDTTIHVCSIGDTLGDFRSTQHDHAP